MARSNRFREVEVILAISTSSPYASAAIFDAEYAVVAADSQLAQQNASGLILAMLQGWQVDLNRFLGIVVDVGPGGFTGTRVGVMLAKALAYAHHLKVAGVSSFDLISTGDIVSVPSRKDAYLTRAPGKAPELRSSDFGMGYGAQIATQVYPDARRAVMADRVIEWMSPFALIPDYVLPPSISTPKTPFKEGVH